MDHVYLCRAGDNEELRYSLRSLAKHVQHDTVWIVGGWPEWVTGVKTLGNTFHGNAGRTKHDRTTSHLRLACVYEGISDPFVMWNDDMFALGPVSEVPVLHNGPLRPRAEHNTWAAGQRATRRWLAQELPGQHLLSYELHVPLVVHKEPMREALRRLPEIGHPVPHKRTVYGNLAQLGGTYSVDVKVMNRQAKTPAGQWISSADATFRSCVLPRLGLDEPGPYES